MALEGECCLYTVLACTLPGCTQANWHAYMMALEGECCLYTVLACTLLGCTQANWHAYMMALEGECCLYTVLACTLPGCTQANWHAYMMALAGQCCLYTVLACTLLGCIHDGAGMRVCTPLACRHDGTVSTPLGSVIRLQGHGYSKAVVLEDVVANIHSPGTRCSARSHQILPRTPGQSCPWRGVAG